MTKTLVGHECPLSRHGNVGRPKPAWQAWQPTQVWQVSGFRHELVVRYGGVIHCHVCCVCAGAPVWPLPHPGRGVRPAGHVRGGCVGGVPQRAVVLGASGHAGHLPAAAGAAHAAAEQPQGSYEAVCAADRWGTPYVTLGVGKGLVLPVLILAGAAAGAADAAAEQPQGW